MIRRPGIKDVAASAGVSIKTVSRVVNAEESVHPETRARVLHAIQALGYVPNTAARSLKSGTGGAIGVVIDSLADPFFAALVSAIESRALEEGLNVLVASSTLDADRERELLLSFVAGHQVAGVIFAPVASEHPYLDPYRTVTPVVAVDRSRVGFDSVVVDDRGASALAIQQLVDLGHERIAFFDRDERFSTIHRRMSGYLDVLRETGIPFDPELVSSTVDGHLDYQSETDRLLALERPATAFFASNAKAAIGLTAALHHSHRAAETAMIAFGDFSFADVLRPGVSCIDQDPFLIGNAAIERLLALREAASNEPREWIVPTALLQRGSGEIAAPVAGRATAAATAEAAATAATAPDAARASASDVASTGAPVSVMRQSRTAAAGAQAARASVPAPAPALITTAGGEA
ncbi:LacI family DNA-binding transcriptional regulator [Herbiconiux sp. KACC 21604]|uniref:LacI family DNA-binding transcriptional regulator n=1 Tax=unclassified Herbiconiux TaxID=2618217 RepID=UPI0014928DD8|nr:LacI family DNA-binding transcriptional regulator [Herbiconiux sp. SALV-R1]QJU53113.1 LacI family DNA-binding transcriptional regulator [Herbiconiux sp. SALV-R1]WPO88052.1 LacI family DNA-binding transcriptional regulator [Herbiconiux sp. KACC 21604]